MHSLKDDIGYWLNRLRMQVHTAFERRLEKHDVSVAQWCILLCVYNKEAQSITELSKLIEVDKASISRVIQNLCDKGLVLHTAGADRRSGLIQLTPQGEHLVPLLIQEAEHNEGQFFGNLTSQEVEDLRHIFHKIAQTVPGLQLEGWIVKSNKERM